MKLQNSRLDKFNTATKVVFLVDSEFNVVEITKDDFKKMEQEQDHAAMPFVWELKADAEEWAKQYRSIKC